MDGLIRKRVNISRCIPPSIVKHKQWITLNVSVQSADQMEQPHTFYYHFYFDNGTFFLNAQYGNRYGRDFTPDFAFSIALVNIIPPSTYRF